MSEQVTEPNRSEDGDEILENDEDAVGTIAAPYDPTKTKIDTDRVSMDTLIKRIRYDEIDLAPDFQRASDLWNDTKKSRLIESMLLRIPLPAFYFDGTDDDRWLVVDGLQRLSTLRAFVIQKGLTLLGLEYLTQLNGMGFDKLPRSMQRRIEETQVTLHIIRPGTPPEVKYNIFRRINTGGMQLTPQEIRHALNPGPVQAFLKALAESPWFRGATDNSIKPKRMTDREYVLRFCAFTLTPPEDYTDDNLDRFLTNAMVMLNEPGESGEQKRAMLESRFIRAMRVALSVFGSDAFRKRFDPADDRNPVNKALFECWSVLLAGLSDAQHRVLERCAFLVNARFIEAMQDGEFVSAISQATADTKHVQYRFRKIAALIDGVVAEADPNLSVEA